MWIWANFAPEFTEQHVLTSYLNCKRQDSQSWPLVYSVLSRSVSGFESTVLHQNLKLQRSMDTPIVDTRLENPPFQTQHQFAATVQVFLPQRTLLELLPHISTMSPTKKWQQYVQPGTIKLQAKKLKVM